MRQCKSSITQINKVRIMKTVKCHPLEYMSPNFIKHNKINLGPLDMRLL